MPVSKGFHQIKKFLSAFNVRGAVENPKSLWVNRV